MFKSCLVENTLKLVSFLKLLTEWYSFVCLFVLRDIWFVSSTGQTCPEGRSTNRTRGPMRGAPPYPNQARKTRPQHRELHALFDFKFSTAIEQGTAQLTPFKTRPLSFLLLIFILLNLLNIVWQYCKKICIDHVIIFPIFFLNCTPFLNLSALPLTCLYNHYFV